MGPIGNLLKMMPGGKQMNEMAAMVDEKQLDRIQAIIRGMTPQERIAIRDQLHEVEHASDEINHRIARFYA